MKMRTKLVALNALFLIFILQPSGLVYAGLPDFDDDDDLIDMVMGALFGAIESQKRSQLPLEDCKPDEVITKPINCGDKAGPGHYVDNYYVIFADKNLHEKTLDPTVGPNNVPLTKEHCQADKLQVLTAFPNEKGFPNELKPGNLATPEGKIAIYWKIRVYNGFGGFDIQLNPQCVYFTG